MNNKLSRPILITILFLSISDAYANELIALNCKNDTAIEPKTFKYSKKATGSFEISFKIPKPNNECVGEACRKTFYGEPKTLFGFIKAEYSPRCGMYERSCYEYDKEIINAPSLEYELNKKFYSEEPPDKLYDSYILNYEVYEKALFIYFLSQNYDGEYYNFGTLQINRLSLDSSFNLMNGDYIIYGSCQLIDVEEFTSQFEYFKQLKEDKLKAEQKEHKESVPERKL